MIRRVPLALTIALSCTALHRAGAQEAPASPMFPFVIPWDDATQNATDVSFLNPAPLEEKHRITQRDGHFYDSTGRRVRFLGVNLAFSANFPDKVDAGKVAARMHKFGINMVRLHHMDGRKAPNGLWDPNFPDFQHLDADQLDRLDYFVAQMKANGIYVDLNLHVSRRFVEADGFPDTDKLPTNGKVTAWFEPRMVELQKKFAREILSHRNPYTGMTYAQDPVCALIEIHNEDSMLDAGRDGRIAALPDHYKNQLIIGWNNFLKAKYKTTASLLAAWNNNGQANTENLISNGQFNNQTAGWRLEQTAPAQGSLEAQEITGTGILPPGRALNLKTTAVDGTHWHLQANYTGLELKDGQNYTLKFWARSKTNRQLTVYAKMDQEPWQDLGLREYVALTPEWKRYELIFKAKSPLPKNNRITFVMGDFPGEFWIADLQLRSGVQLDGGQSLEEGNINLYPPSGSPWGEDATHYLMEIERQYSQGMYDLIKKELGAQGLVTCSQSSYGGLGGVWRESKMDFVDMHAYWQHPSFPGRPWDSQNWVVNNVAMVANPNYGTLPNLAMNRVEGKPFTVSEYNHPAPNDFTAETLPLIMSYAAWQDWDGIFLFDYNSERTKWSTDRIEGFFSMGSHPGKLAFLPASALLFLRGAPPASTTPLTLKVPTDQLNILSAAHKDTKSVWQAAGINASDILPYKLGVQFVPNGNLTAGPLNPQATTWPLQWTPASGQFKYAAPQVQIAVNTYTQPVKVDFTDWKYELATSRRGFAALALASRDGKPIAQSQSLLLTAAGNIENQNMGWNAERTSVGNKWGTGPVLAEGIGATISLKTGAEATVYALDGTGARAQTVPTQWNNGELQFLIGPQYKTMWYEIAARK